MKVTESLWKTKARTAQEEVKKYGENRMYNINKAAQAKASWIPRISMKQRKIPYPGGTRLIRFTH